STATQTEPPTPWCQSKADGWSNWAGPGENEPKLCACHVELQSAPCTKKEVIPVAEQDQPTKRVRFEESEPSRSTSAHIYAKYARELSTWPEVVALRSSTEDTVAADLVRVRTFATGHLVPSLAIYRRLGFMRATIEKLYQEASDCDGDVPQTFVERQSCKDSSHGHYASSV
ncbi:hypothetical protein Hypma_009842, partial [Hypsizygus marmoreus]